MSGIDWNALDKVKARDKQRTYLRKNSAEKHRINYLKPFTSGETLEQQARRIHSPVNIQLGSGCSMRSNSMPTF